MTASLTESDFRRFQSIVYRTAGIYLAPSKHALVVARLSRRLRALELRRYRDYLDHVERDSDELVNLLDCIATNETRFFREQRQFDYLQSVLVPQWIADAAAGRRARALQIWSAGCATGEEPYSVAMCILANLPPGQLWDVAVLATDLSTRALRAASEGVWPMSAAEHIPQPWLKRFMLRGHGAQQGKMKAGPELRSAITFHRLNLNEDEYPVGGGFDLILCRNVLIYFDAASRRRVVQKLTERLAPGAHLLIGHAESLHSVTDRVHPVSPTIYRMPQSQCTS